MAASTSPLYLGFDLSTQQLKAIVITSTLEPVAQEAVNFDTDLPHYGVSKGVHVNDEDHSVYAPVAMWIEAVDVLLNRFKKSGLDFGRIKGISGAGQQHGSVYWSYEAEKILAGLDPKRGLLEQVNPGALSHKWSPNWQDHSTEAECEVFEEKVGGPVKLAGISGSDAHHRFTGPQILKLKNQHPEIYDKTDRISLVSSFLASIFLGKIAPIDISDVCGMNLWDIKKEEWSDVLLEATAGVEGKEELRRKLGKVEEDGGANLGTISPYFVSRYGFPTDTMITPFTGDNPSTILALPLRPLDVIISLGTSTTVLMSTPNYIPSPDYHLFGHPTTPHLYMFMLCYKNGALARETIRNTLNLTSPPTPSDPWSSFSHAITSTPPLCRPTPSSPAKLGIYFPLPEIVPNAPSGTYKFDYNTTTSTLTSSPTAWTPTDDARAIVESQALSMRSHSTPLLTSPGSLAQPHRIYLVGGGSKNAAIASVIGDVLGGSDGVYELDVGGNACALGAAYKALWAVERKGGESFDDLIGGRWDEKGRVKKVGEGYSEGLWEEYGKAMVGYEEAERRVMAGEARNLDKE